MRCLGRGYRDSDKRAKARKTRKNELLAETKMERQRERKREREKEREKEREREGTDRIL